MKANAIHTPKPTAGHHKAKRPKNSSIINAVPSGANVLSTSRYNNNSRRENGPGNRNSTSARLNTIAPAARPVSIISSQKPNSASAFRNRGCPISILG